MRKLFSLALAVCLALSVAAFAETSAQLVTYDFGDFTIDFPADIMGSIGEPVNGQVFAIFYENYDEAAPFNANLNLVWNEDADDLSAIDPVATGNMILQQTCVQVDAMGAQTSNPMLLAATVDSFNGKPALLVAFSYDVDYSGVGLDYQTTLYTAQIIASEEGLGTYAFSETVEDLNGTPILDAMIESVVWKN